VSLCFSETPEPRTALLYKDPLDVNMRTPDALPCSGEATAVWKPDGYAALLSNNADQLPSLRYWRL
jgi:hypothetical protein